MWALLPLPAQFRRSALANHHPEDTPYWLALSRVPGLGYGRIQQLLNRFGSLERAWNAHDAGRVTAWYAPDGLDGDEYAWDSFICTADTAITRIKWRGLYQYSANGFAHAPEQVYADVSRFAAFRLILIDLLQNNAERAAGRLAWLQANHPDAAATGAAATLLAGWAGAAGQAALCASIESGLAAVENPTGALSDMGYGNPALLAGDLCP